MFDTRAGGFSYSCYVFSEQTIICFPCRKDVGRHCRAAPASVRWGRGAVQSFFLPVRHEISQSLFAAELCLVAILVIPWKFLWALPPSCVLNSMRAVWHKITDWSKILISSDQYGIEERIYSLNRIRCGAVFIAVLILVVFPIPVQNPISENNICLICKIFDNMKSPIFYCIRISVKITHSGRYW